ncbi:hypothetical protein F5888DRAFT_655532 [Russula emetica]|nr:hypothetical protein F5888DRAFT_655532 [Russula emetica]
MAHQQAPTARDLLYTHGYIARMLGTMQAPGYFTHLLRIDERYMQLVVANHAFWLLHPSHILDYMLRDVGTVVSQRLWSPAATSDAQRYGNGSVPLNMPIFFVQSDGTTLGLPLNQAASGNCSALLNAHRPAPVGQQHTTFIRILWSGYSEWSSQIMTRDQTPAHNTIPMEALAARVARAVCRFLQDCAGQRCTSPAWFIGRGGITANDIILVGLIQVTQGSWQPILQLNRFVFSQSSNIR